MRPRVHDADIVSNEVLTVLLADLTPTPVMGQFKQPTPMSSISWALELRPVEGDPGDGWWRADTDALVGRRRLRQSGRSALGAGRQYSQPSLIRS